MRQFALLSLLVVAIGTTSAIPTFARNGLLPGQPMYSGSGVGPLWLFRSSATNAEIVNAGFKGHPIARSSFLAVGDELPNLRDDVIRRFKDAAATPAPTGQRSFVSSLIGNPVVGALISPSNLKLDRENSKNEVDDPYKRPGVLSSVTGLLGGAGGAGGILQTITGLASSFIGGGGAAGAGGVASASAPSGGFRITSDSVTRAPSSLSSSLNSVEDTGASSSDIASILAAADSSSASTEASRRR